MQRPPSWFRWFLLPLAGVLVVRQAYPETSLHLTPSTGVGKAPAQVSALQRNDATSTTAGTVTAAPSSLSFGKELITVQSGGRVVKLTNNSSQPVTISSVIISGNFVIVRNQCGSTLAANASCNIVVAFQPLSLANLTGTLTISDSASNSPQLVSLSGQGVTTGLTSITISPANAAIAIGGAQAFVATGNRNAGGPLNLTGVVNWSSSNLTVASINASGLASGLALGSATVGAQLGTFSSAAILTVVAPGMVSIAVSPTNPSLNIGQSQQFTATGTYSDGSRKDVTLQATWSSSNTSVVSLSTSGLATGLTLGTSQVSATLNSFSSLTTVTVAWPIQHIIVIMKENHSFDSYFGTFPGANGATSGKTSTGQTLSLSHALDQPLQNCGHTWADAHNAIDGGAMDRFDRICPNNQSYVQYLQSDIPNYWTYAQTFGLADNFYSSLEGPSFPNHLYLVASQSANIVDVPNGSITGTGYCDSGTNVYVNAYNPVTGKNYQTSPCIDVQTMADELDKAGVSWAYYADTVAKSAQIWNPFAAISHIRFGSDYQNVKSYTQFVNDAASGSLPQVVWITSSWPFSEHPAESVTKGENWTVAQINAVMSNPTLWNNSVIFVSWDDFGGFYDHVPPPGVDAFGLGPRVPLLCIGPYCKNAISHTQLEFDSFNRCIENIFGLQALTARDAGATDICADMMNYSQVPIPALLLPIRTLPADLHPVTDHDGKPSDDDD